MPSPGTIGRHRTTALARTLRRSVSVGPDTDVVVHRRADWKDVYPDYWDIAFGGVCGVGEAWLPSARRELEEEAGLVDVPILPLGAGRYVEPGSCVFGGLFVVLDVGGAEAQRRVKSLRSTESLLGSWPIGRIDTMSAPTPRR